VFLDQNSRNGSFVLEASERVERRVLADGDRLLIGDVILCFLRAPELPQKRRAALEYIAQHDALTRAYNQKTWLAEMERQVLHARGDGRALSALLVGIDELGVLRARIGRLAAESLLASMALCLRRTLGEAAIIGRHASEEFGVILPGIAAPGATALAERLRMAAAAQTLTLCGQAATTTISVGVATLYRTTGAEELVEDALAALARARLAGRNAVSGPQEAAA
jgi:diguanylate cyclase (GGDEF)-like protein